MECIIKVPNSDVFRVRVLKNLKKLKKLFTINAYSIQCGSADNRKFAEYNKSTGAVP